MNTPQPNSSGSLHPVCSASLAMDASIEDMLSWAIAELRVKHAEAEAVFPWTTKEEYQYRKAMMDEFNICAWNNVPFILDQLEARMSKPNSTIGGDSAAILDTTPKRSSHKAEI